MGAKRLYIPLPDERGRRQLVDRLLEKEGKSKHALTSTDVEKIVADSKGYSGSDLSQLCKEAALAPLRRMIHSGAALDDLHSDSIAPMTIRDFESAFQSVRPSVHQSELAAYEEWDRQFGS